jgi:hypothetical protein
MSRNEGDDSPYTIAAFIIVVIVLVALMVYCNYRIGTGRGPLPRRKGSTEEHKDKGLRDNQRIKVRLPHCKQERNQVFEEQNALTIA